MTIHVANIERLVHDALAIVLEPPPPIDFAAWAADNVIFTDGPVTGPYNRDLFPEFEEILKALGPEDPCRIVTLKKSAQMGGTVLANIFTLGSMHLDPSDFLWVCPTIDLAQRHSKTKLGPMMRASPAIAPLFPQKSRDGSDSVLFKERADGRGSILLTGANSAPSLSQVSMRRQVQDDLAKFEMNSAGDPENQADSRSRAFEFAKILKCSTPLIANSCRISRNFLEGSQEYFEVPCPHCGHFQVLEWLNMLATIEVDAEDPHFTCTGCGCEIREHHRAEIKRRGRWRCDNPQAQSYHRSFWLWSAYSVLQSFQTISREWLKAKGDPGQERVFFNDALGLPYETKGEAPPWEELAKRAAESDYERRHVPAGALILTAGVDVQSDRVEWQVVGWGREARSWTIEHGVVPGHISEPKTQAQLDALLVQAFPNSAGRGLAIDRLAIDGNAWTEDVWAWAHRHAKVIMVRGVGSDSAPLLAKVKRDRNRKGEVLRYQAKFYNFATSVLKMALYRNVAKTDPLARGYVGFPQGLEDEFFRQLTAERRQAVKRKDGFVVHQWVKDPAQANEGLDTRLQAEAAAIHFGIRSFQDATWDKYEAERETAPEAAQGDLLELLPLMAAAAPTPPPPPVHRKPGTPAGQDQAATPTPAPPDGEAARKAWMAKIAERLGR